MPELIDRLPAMLKWQDTRQAEIVSLEPVVDGAARIEIRYWDAGNVHRGKVFIDGNDAELVLDDYPKRKGQ